MRVRKGSGRASGRNPGREGCMAYGSFTPGGRAAGAVRVGGGARGTPRSARGWGRAGAGLLP
ncbi:hypothetical protein GCM10010300_58400 [Streptomyces olivaceoviridis]|nr:hypothetical protein GCM10010300_58400 [Streptomyces olivaceoviridis]